MKRFLFIFMVLLVTAVAGCHAIGLGVTTSSSTPPPNVLKYRGTNLSGGEFGDLPGEYGKTYQYPSQSDVDFFAALGMTHIRLPIRHEHIQPTLKGPLSIDEWNRLYPIVTYITTKKGMAVTLELHNYYRHNGHILTETEIGDVWGRIAGGWKDNPRVMINVTNEPHDMSTEQVVALDNAALKEIRRVGFTGLVHVPGNGWTGGGHWLESWYGTPNSKAMLGVKSDDATVFEVHQYLDAQADGTGNCVSETIGVERLSDFTSWLRSNSKKGWLGEIGAMNTPTCQSAVTKTLQYIESNYDVWVGWDVWGAGVWSFATTYGLSIGPTPPGAPTKPQLAWYLPFLPKACAP